jgi:alpha-1,3-rhamnosyl/mannosyltransferase
MTSKQIIYVEATPLVRKNRTGVDYYVNGLLSQLIKCMPDTEFRFFYFVDQGDKLSLSGKNVKTYVIHGMESKKYRLRLLLGIAPSVEQLLGVNNIECILFTNFYSYPVKSKNATIIPFVYDTTYIDTPSYVATKNRLLLKRLVKRSVRKATKIIAISEATKKALRGHYGRSDKDYQVIYPAPTTHTTKKKIVSDMPSDFFLFVGTLEPRKNVANLIRAHLMLDEEYRKKYPLVLAGGKGWHDEEILSLLQQNKGNYIYQLGYVDDRQKAWLYRCAYALVYPALFEGFGMPIVEALASGLPVITCKNSSLPEAGGEAAIYCDESTEGIVEGMLACIRDDDRAGRIKAGVAHANKFSWTESANKLKSILGEMKD